MEFRLSKKIGHQTTLDTFLHTSKYFTLIHYSALQYTEHFMQYN